MATLAGFCALAVQGATIQRGTDFLDNCDSVPGALTGFVGALLVAGGVHEFRKRRRAEKSGESRPKSKRAPWTSEVFYVFFGIALMIGGWLLFLASCHFPEGSS